MTWDDEMTFSQRVYQAYQALAGETKSPDVPIHSLRRRVGGSVHELHDWLRQECYAQNCVPTVGEPLYAGDAARQSALTLPGEVDRATGKPVVFLNVKLLEPPMIEPQQKPPQSPVQRYERLLRETAALKYPESERTPELESRIARTIARKVQEFAQEQRVRDQVRAYEQGLRKELDLKQA